MQIEEAIKQKKPFKNERHRAIVNLLFTNNIVRHRHKTILKAYDLTLQQFNVLRILRGANQPISTRMIRERLVDKMADASRLVSRLAQKKLVDRTTSQGDKRLVDVSLSEAGQELLEKIDVEKMTAMYDVLGQLSEKEAVVLNKLLDKIRLD